MTPALIEAVVRWAEHAAKNSSALLAVVQNLRRPTGVVDVDQHNALLAELLQGVHDHLQENPA